MMEDKNIYQEKTIYQKYDKLLASNTALSEENSILSKRIDKLAAALERVSVTKEDVEKAKATYEGTKTYALGVIDAATAAWDKYIKLKEAFGNGNQRRSSEG